MAKTRSKYFYPPRPGNGAGTFSDEIVGLQTVTGGGLTQGNFEFTTNVVEKVNRTSHKYFDICDRIRNLMILRNNIIQKCMNDVGIEKLKTEVQLNKEVSEKVHPIRTETM